MWILVHPFILGGLQFSTAELGRTFADIRTLSLIIQPKKVLNQDYA